MSGTYTTTGFPPATNTTLQTVIPSYLYKNFSDDDNLQGFVMAFNELAQGYLNWFNNVQLPVYTGLSGPLLDWIAQGVYGISRPALSQGRQTAIGPFNTWRANTLPFNTRKVIQNATFYAVSDDIFKRIITWNFYKGDGNNFTIEWLKKRVQRFLIGTNGTAPIIDQTNQISVTFGTNYQIDINILHNKRTLTGGALFNRNRMNKFRMNSVTTTYQTFPKVPLALIFASAMSAGVLQIPFEFTCVVNY